MKKIPKFKTEAEEREFWANADFSDYVDWSKASRILLPNIKPSLRTISLRLPELVLEELKLIANKKDVPYQSLIKIFLSERLSKELNACSGTCYIFMSHEHSLQSCNFGYQCILLNPG